MEGEEAYKTTYTGGIPPRLHASHDARNVALQTYQLSFGVLDNKPKYFDFFRDILCLIGCPVDWEVEHNGVYKDLKLVRHLATLKP